MRGYKRVVRPQRSRDRYDYKAIILTATKGDAVVVPLNGRLSITVRAAIHQTLRRRGYKSYAKYRKAAKALIVWCERRPEGR